MKIFEGDSDDDLRAGSGPFHFGPELFWMLQQARFNHDKWYTRIRKGETNTTYADADRKFIEDVGKLIELHADQITPAQKRWALLVRGWCWPAFRIWEALSK